MNSGIVRSGRGCAGPPRLPESTILHDGRGQTCHANPTTFRAKTEPCRRTPDSGAGFEILVGLSRLSTVIQPASSDRGARANLFWTDSRGGFARRPVRVGIAPAGPMDVLRACIRARCALLPRSRIFLRSGGSATRQHQAGSSICHERSVLGESNGRRIEIRWLLLLQKIRPFCQPQAFSESVSIVLILSFRPAKGGQGAGR
jgi:hypothetical protein